MSKEEREALVDVIIYLFSALFPVCGAMPERIQRDIAILQGEQSDVAED